MARFRLLPLHPQVLVGSAPPRGWWLGRRRREFYARLTPDPVARNRLHSVLGHGSRRLIFGLAGVVASAMLALIGAFVGALVPAFVMVAAAKDDLIARGHLLLAGGHPFFPGLQTLSAVTLGDQLQSALILALPLAAFFGVIVATLCLLDELVPILSGRMLPLLLVTHVLLATALASQAGLTLALLFCLPGSLAYIAYFLTWRRRLPHRVPREGGKPGMFWHPLISLLVFSIGIASTWCSAFTNKDYGGFTGFRDCVLLPSALGRSLSDFYYENTPLAAAAIQPATDLYQPRVALTEAEPSASLTTWLSAEGYALVPVSEAPADSLAAADFLITHADPAAVAVPRLQPSATQEQAQMLLHDTDDRAFIAQLWGVAIRIGLPWGSLLALISLMTFAMAGPVFIGIFTRLKARRRHIWRILTLLATGVLLLFVVIPFWWKLSHRRGPDGTPEAAYLHSHPAVLLQKVTYWRNAYAVNPALRFDFGDTPLLDVADMDRPTHLDYVLQVGLASEHPGIRLRALGAVVLKEDPRYRDWCVGLLDDPVLNVRYAAVKTLLAAPDQETRRLVEAVANDTDELWYVRAYAWYGLHR